MEDSLKIIEQVGREFGVGAELRQLIRHGQLVERLSGEGSGVGLILEWMETAADDLSALANVFHPSSQTAAHFRGRADRMRVHVRRLRALGLQPTSALSIPESSADELEHDQTRAGRTMEKAGG